MIKITDFGAEENKLCTKKIQRAIDACPTGGTVIIPAGHYISGALFLKSDMTLYLEKGAYLIGSTDTADYPVFRYRWEGEERLSYASLINTVEGSHKNIAIAGGGVIDASGSELRKKELTEKDGAPGRAVCVRNTDGVRIEDVTVRQSPAWCVHIIYCENVVIENVEIHSKYDENGVPYPDIVNGDGIDIDSCRHVHISNSLIESEDDNIAIKSGRDAEGRKVGIASEDILIESCRFYNGFGVAIGSEMSGGVRNVTVRTCVYKDSFCAASVKTRRGRGGKIENIRFENCKLVNEDEQFSDCKWFKGCIYIDMFYAQTSCDTETAEKFSEETPAIGNIILKDINLETIGGKAIYICGLPESPVGSVCMENIKAKGRYGIFTANIKRLTAKNMSVEIKERNK